MFRGITPEDAPSRTAIALRTQAHNFLRIALNSDDRMFQEKYLNAAREVLAEMEVAIEKARIENSADANNDLWSPPSWSICPSESDAEHERESSDSEEEDEELEEDEESERADEEGDDESEEDRQWGEEEEDKGGEEEEWDINNGENGSTPPATDPLLTHYFTNGPGKPGLTAMKDVAADKRVNLQHNLDIRVYARLMELFEIESRYRLDICNAEQASREKAARENLAELKVSKLVSEPI
jgi:hypothetical protein